MSSACSSFVQIMVTSRGCHAVARLNMSLWNYGNCEAGQHDGFLIRTDWSDIYSERLGREASSYLCGGPFLCRFSCSTTCEKAKAGRECNVIHSQCQWCHAHACIRGLPRSSSHRCGNESVVTAVPQSKL